MWSRYIKSTRSEARLLTDEIVLYVDKYIHKEHMVRKRYALAYSHKEICKDIAICHLKCLCKPKLKHAGHSFIVL